jgi:DNA replication and repair protein RecF
MTGLAPVLLLDEVAAHLDPARRTALFEALVALRLQVIMTGADPGAFAAIAPQAAVFAVKSGELTRST